MQIWPAIDLRGGKCVRLRQGDYQRETIFGDDPAEMAAKWQALGARYLHLVDLDAAKDGSSSNRSAVRAILESVSIPCELGGGVRDEATIESLLDLGMQRLVIGTRAVREPEWTLEMSRKYPDRLVIGIDAREGKVATDGWLETSAVSAIDLAQQFAEAPIAGIVYTDISRDGMMAGANVEAMAEMQRQVDWPVIASGGVTTLEDVRQLAAAQMAGCIIGRSLYEGQIDLPDAIAIGDEAEKHGNSVA